MAERVVAKAKPASNGNRDEFEAARQELFVRRITRLEQVSVQLRHLYRDHTQCLIAERQQKADVYLNSQAPSHGERQGIASAQTSALSTEALLLKGEIDALVEERDFLRFCIEYDGGA